MMEPYRIELPTIFGMKTVNSYLFTEPEPVLVDCGEKSDEGWYKLNHELAQHQLRVRDIRKVFITHAHIDHMGMAGKIVENSEAEVWVSPLVKEWAINLEQAQQKRSQLIQGVLQQNIDLEKAPFGKGFASLFGRFHQFWDEIPEDRVKVFDLNGKIDMGGSTWQVIYAPGHCINQTCFYQAETKQLISADMLLKITPSPVIEADPEPPFERMKSLAIMLESYDKFAQMDIEKVYPGHYEPFGNHKDLIDHQVYRIHQRKEACFDLIKAGHHNFMELLGELYKDRISFPAFPMLIGYLDLLLDENRIFTEHRNGILSYRVLS
jgi:glyoxylase-like metal-dependent hydrolase (beta-lactamase superfamily II)